ncbi:MAG: hypothetical protein MUE34_09555 [Acidimicrobiales bacterium]|nr:hypothetical protein [Acidimicrobiales bacterium]
MPTPAIPHPAFGIPCVIDRSAGVQPSDGFEEEDDGMTWSENEMRGARTPRALEETVERIEEARLLDQFDAPLRSLATTVAAGGRRAVLRGEPLGHALHPLLTDFPLGCWLAAGLLDLTGGRSSRRAAQRLIGLGLLFVPPTAAAGMTDWSEVRDDRVRRVGIAHAVGNTVVALLYLRSWRARRRGHHLRGVLWGMAGGSLAWGTGYLGGHLSFGTGTGVGERGMRREASSAAAVDVEREIDIDEAMGPMAVSVGGA